MKTLFSLFLLSGFAVSASAIDYKTDVLPIMKEHCWDCHSNEKKVKGSLALDDLDEMRDYQVGKFNIIRPGDPAESSFLEKLHMDKTADDFMPRNGDPLPKEHLAKIENWIKAGAVIDADNLSEKEKAYAAEMGGGKAGEVKEQYLKWKSADGKEIEARFMALDGEAVKLLMKGGKSYTVPFSKLDAASVEQAKKLGSS